MEIRPESPTLGAQFSSFLQQSKPQSMEQQQQQQPQQQQLPLPKSQPRSRMRPLTIPSSFCEKEPPLIRKRVQWNLTKILWLTAIIVLVIIFIAHCIDHFLALSIVEQTGPLVTMDEGRQSKRIRT